jgi:peptide/nickel transport system substrate-binding protein
MRIRSRAGATIALLTAALTLASCGSAGPSGPGEGGGSATVLELASTAGAWPGLDPLTNASASINHDFFDAVYGQLFRRAAGGRLVPELATGYTIRPGGLEVEVSLRPGVTFSDGTAFDADAVAFNLRRDLAPAAGCRCLANFAAVSSIGTAGHDQVVLHLRTPDPWVIDAFVDAAPNWIVSPTALRSLGETRFAVAPVGAGPFTVVSDQLNSTLALTANPRYWHQGYPKLRRLTFTSVTDDASAYLAMRAGQAQLYPAFGTPSLLGEMTSHFTAVPMPATQAEAVNLNVRSAPFGALLAREAIYYATDAAAIDAHVLDGAGTLSQAPGGPADQYWTATVPGYRGPDLPRARALVQQLGGLSFTLSALNTPVQLAIVQALQGQWARAGIEAKISLISIPQAVQQSRAGTLQAIATQVGSYNPRLVPGLAASYSSTGPFSLVRDHRLDALIDAAAAATDDAAARAKYEQVYAHLREQAYAPFLFTMNQWNVAARTVHGLTPLEPEIDWEAVSVSGS